MLITEIVQIKIHNKHLTYYKTLYPEIKIGDIINIPPNELYVKSTTKIECQCEICGFRKILEYRYYIKNTKTHKIYTCSPKCSNIKKEMTNLIKYGVKYHSMNTDVFKEKVKKTSNERYGKDYYTQTKDWSKSFKETNLIKYGETTPLKSKTIIEKIKNTKKTKYGYSGFNNVEKRKITNMLKYGFDNPSKSELIKEKTKQTNNDKYGVDWPNQNIEVFNENQTKRFKTKNHKNLFYKSSYELDFIILCEQNNILIENGPTIKYSMFGKNKIYFPDFYIPKLNLIVEIKSSYTYNLEKEINLIKKTYSELNNYKFIFIIDKDYSNFLSLII